MGLIAEAAHGRIAVDTAVFIYYIEEHPRFLAAVAPLFEAADAGRLVLVTSALTLLEVLVVPLRAGDGALAGHYEALLTSGRGIELAALDHEALRAAAEIRAATGARTPDALHRAAALRAGCETLVTNDRRLPAVPGLRVLQVSDYAAA